MSWFYSLELHFFFFCWAWKVTRTFKKQASAILLFYEIMYNAVWLFIKMLSQCKVHYAWNHKCWELGQTEFIYNLGSILWRHFHYQITQFLIIQLRANYLFVKTIQAFKSQLISWYSFWQDFTNYAGNIEGFIWRRYWKISNCW